jgi:hypothetical protein
MTKKFFLNLSLSISVLTSARMALAQNEEPRLSFIDPETRTASDVDVGDGLKAIVILPLVSDHRRIDFEVLVFPEFKLDEVPLYQKKFKQERSDQNNIWRKSFKIPSFGDKDEIISRFGHVARVRIQWKNEQDGTEGTLIRKYYLLEARDQKFFKILEPGELKVPTNADPETVCSYRKNIETVGPYLQNPSLSPQEYEFNQSVAFENLRYRGPLNITPTETLGIVEKITPLFQASEGSLGWLMTGWTHFEGKETKLAFKPKIVLQAAQGGYFLKETIMKRFKAQKFIFDHKGLVGSKWVEKEVGLLDVGVPQYDFVTLSFEDSQDPAKLERLLAERSQMMSTCEGQPGESARVFHTNGSNSLHEEMFFTALN